MKQNIFLLIFVSFGICAMEAPASKLPNQPGRSTSSWTEQTSALEIKLTEGARKTIILTEDQARRVAEHIKFVVSSRPAHATANKLIVIMVYKGDEPYAKLLGNAYKDAAGALKNMAISLAEIRFNGAAGQEKGRPLAASISYASDSEVELISYAYGPKRKDEIEDEKETAKLLDLFVHSLESLNPDKNLKIVFVAAEESAHIVNMMSRLSKRNPIDSLIYFQSPIYEWTPSVSNYSYHEDVSPQNFLHLYHLYTKGSKQIPGYSPKSLLYLERKYRQQARIENGRLISPVKNIRALKVNNAGQLENFAFDDFFSDSAIKNYATLFVQADTYNVNSDLIAKVFDPNQAPSACAINRFVRLSGNSIEQSVGASVLGYEYYYPVITLEGISLKEIRRAFSIEVEESMGQLINITSIPTEQGWYVISKLLGDVSSDIARIKLMHAKVLSSQLYEFKVDANADQFSYIISNKVKDAIKSIANESGLSQEFIEGQIKLGAYYMSLLLRDQSPKIPTRNQEEYLRSIISVIWFLYSQAIENGQKFDEGTFVIEDLGWRVNNFLMTYVAIYGNMVSGYKKQNRIEQPLTETLADPDLNMSFNGFAYPRESSHFKVSQKLFRHYGIDVRFGDSGELPLLPASKRHILFGKIDQNKQLLFIKPENYGIYYKDGFIYHGSEFIESNARKFGLTSKTDDDPSYAKERIPATFLKEFKAALAASGIPDKQQAELLALAKQDDYGIKILYYDDLLAKPAVQELEQKYSKLFNHLKLRTGREVIITHQDLQKILRIDQQPLVAWVQKPVIIKAARPA